MTSRSRLATLATLVALLGLASAACGSDSEDSSTASESTSSSSEPSSEPAESQNESEGKSEGKDSGEQQETEAAPMPGAYVTWSDYEADPDAYAETDVVLFFHADWCHSCRGTEESIDADGVPDGLTVVKVDYDNSPDLRQQYGITVQHTFVQVDQDGRALNTWTGSETGADIAAQTA